MTGNWHRWLVPACVLATLSAGCGSPATFTVETIVHPHGSCDRTICQPRTECLPAEALKPEWNARWKSVTDVKGPSASPRAGRPVGTEEYFIARGSFRSPREIPPHYRLANDEVPQVGASELERSYERIDWVFVAEHRWRERITDIVTLPGFLETRDKLLDILLPLALRFIGEEFGPKYDLSGLSAFIRTDIRQALEEASLLLYDAGHRRRIRRDDDTMDPELFMRLAVLSKRLGFDLLDAGGEMITQEEAGRRFEDFLRRMVLQHVRHRDGSALDRSEADALIARARTDSHFMKPDERQEERLKRFVVPLVPRMMGLYNVPLAFLLRGGPRYDFALQLPGELIETNGVVFKNGRTRWTFTGDQIFPVGYEMKARSLEIDREAQRKALGRVAIDDEETALEFLEIVGNDRSLLEAVRKLKETGDRAAFDDDKKRSSQQILRAGRLREMLFGR
jgi:hypothetical protein